MEGLDASERYENQPQSDQSPSLLTIILDTNPAAWALLNDSLPLSKAVADLLVFINAHLACQYTNKIAVIASHSDKAQFLFPTPTEQKSSVESNGLAQGADGDVVMSDVEDVQSNERRRQNPSTASNGNRSNVDGSKYRPFLLVEEEVSRNLQNLLSSTTPDKVSAHTSTMVAGALTLALSYINRETIVHNEAMTGSHPNFSDSSTTQAATANSSGNTNSLSNPLQSRILLIMVSPSTDLAHQYIPIMNSIFACQRLTIPIDVLQILLPSHSTKSTTTTTTLVSSSNIGGGGSSSSSSSNSTVFLQQAADATHGIFIPAQLTLHPLPPRSSSSSTTTTILKSPTSNSSIFLTYLLTAFLSPPSTRTHLILPTRIDVDFRAACFCHRNVISTGFVCSICLSIFCSVPENGECLTCGTALKLGDYGGRPVVVPRRPRKKKKGAKTSGSTRADGGDSGFATPLAVH